MEFFPDDPEIQRLLPKETRILDMQAKPYPDGKRMRVTLDLTPFQKKPYIDLRLTDSDGNEAGSTSIVEPITWKLELTLHIKNISTAAGKYTLIAFLSYPEMDKVDRNKITFEIPNAEEE
jgi:hypothetical protein